MKNHVDAAFHTRGESLYVDDNPEPAGMLHVAVFGSPLAHGTIRRFALSAARALAGVAELFTAKDIPGQDGGGPILKGPGLLVEELGEFIGHRIRVAVAESRAVARRA